MPEVPPVIQDSRRSDLEQLRVLMVLHFVLAALALVGLAFLAAHYAFLHFMLTLGARAKPGKEAPPEAFFAMFRWFYVVAGTFVVCGGLINLLSAFWLRSRTCRTGSLVVAGLDLCFVPLGTALGAFTFVVLLRPSVQELYAAGAAPPA